MAYPQKLLGQGETIAFEMKPHWRALIWPLSVLVLLVFIGTWLYISLGSWFAGGVIETVGRWGIVIAGIIILVWWVLLPFARWITTEYVFTNRRIITRAGLVARQGRDMPLSKINNVSFDVPAMGRFLNYGSLRIESAGEGDLVIDDVPNVEVIQREVYRLHEEDDERRRRGSAATGGDPVPPNDGT